MISGERPQESGHQGFSFSLGGQQLPNSGHIGCGSSTLSVSSQTGVSVEHCFLWSTCQNPYWRPAFYILPPKVQIKILTETQMTSSEIRCMKLVSKGMKYLIERGGRHLTKQDLRYCCIDEVSRTICTNRFFMFNKCIHLKIQIAPGTCKVISMNNHRRQHISLEHFSQILAHSHISHVFINRHIRKNKIICRTLILGGCNFNDKENGLCIVGYTNQTNSFNEEFFWMPSVRKLRELCIHGLCHFSDDDLSAGNYRWQRLINCCLSEHALRRIIEEVLECKRDIECYTFKVQKRIDVDRLLDGLPNIQKITERQWTLRDIKDQVMKLSIVNEFLIFKMSAN
uniref:F-box domain-containing protein n=1 Tax=Heterorhabditis bacteriophora TaxID=37862 RepID=A0A1I7WGG5_HETBA